MQIALKILCYAIITLIVGAIISVLKKSKPKESKNECVVYLSKFLPIVGAICSAFFLVPAFITLYSDESIWLLICFFFFVLFVTILIIAYFNCRIYYNEEEFTVKYFIGIKRTFTYDQITGLRKEMHETYLYMGKHRAMIDEFSVGSYEFLNLAQRKYRQNNNGKYIPTVLKKHDIFKGNIKDSGSLVIAYTIFEVVLIGFLAFVLYHTYGNFTTNNLENTQVIFSECIEKDNTLYLTSNDDYDYRIRFLTDDFDTDKIKSICDGKTVYTVYSQEITPDDEDNYFSIKAIAFSDKFILSFDETKKLYINEYKILVFISVLFLALWNIFVILSIIVGRNPQKFSRKFVKLFFKEGYVKYH